MSTTTKPNTWVFVADSKVVSKPGASITVTELILTERGKQAITSGISGIREGAKGWPDSTGPKRNVPSSAQ